EGPDGAALSGATVLVSGVALVESATTAGLYEGALQAHPDLPLRALVAVELPGGLRLRALSAPVWAECDLTLLNGGQPLRLSLTARGGASAGGVAGNTSTAATGSGALLLTHAAVVPAASGGEGVAVDEHRTWAGPLTQVFV